MAIVVVNKNIYKVDSLYQWDKNQDLEIQGLSLPTIPEIHFTNDAMDRAIVRQATMDDKGIITVEIPNSLLQKPYKITAYVCIYEDETFKSLYKLEIPVKARKKPGDYTLENDEEVYSFNALENLVNNTLAVLTEKCDDTIERADEYYNKTITDTTAIKNEAIGEITEVKNNGVSALTQIKENAVSEMNIIKDNTINEATEIKNEAIEECERIKEEIQNSSNDSLTEDIEELRDDLDNHITEMTPISQIVEGSTKPITSGAIHSLKTELSDSLGDINDNLETIDFLDFFNKTLSTATITSYCKKQGNHVTGTVKIDNSSTFATAQAITIGKMTSNIPPSKMILCGITGSGYNVLGIIETNGNLQIYTQNSTSSVIIMLDYWL